jgi:Bacterial transcriptional activator domain
MKTPQVADFDVRHAVRTIRARINSPHLPRPYTPRRVPLCLKASAAIQATIRLSGYSTSASALRLYRGEVLPAAGDGDWVKPHRTRLEEARMTLVEA